MTYEDIRYDIADDGVATLTLDRPEVMNALRPQTSREMFDVIDDVRTNDAVRCLVITGEGRGFLAPATTSRPSSSPRTAATARSTVRSTGSSHGESSLDVIFGLEKPTIAALNGPGVGYGMDIALTATSASPPRGPSSAGSSCGAA